MEEEAATEKWMMNSMNHIILKECLTLYYDSLQ